MSTEESFTPKRRSSAANRRQHRRTNRQATGQSQPKPHTTTAAPAEPASQNPLRRLRRPNPAQVPATAPEPATPPTPQDRNKQRREERRAAKAAAAKSQQPSGVGRIVNNERVSGLRRFYRDTSSEIRKVIWPDRDTTLHLTLLVIAMSIVLGALLGGIDFVMYKVFEAII